MKTYIQIGANIGDDDWGAIWLSHMPNHMLTLKE